MRQLLTLFLVFGMCSAFSQVFEDEAIQKTMIKGVNHIYDANYDSAAIYIFEAEKLLPDHPVIPLMKAMNLLWTNIPLINDSIFAQMQIYLNHSVALSRAKDPKLQDPEFIYFSLAAYGLLAEYYAEDDNYIKAVGAANKAYGLLRKGFDHVDENPEFLLTSGLYNYFREKYPEKYPIYKPLLWFFRSGDKEKGIAQLKRATTETFFSKVEAHVYLSYIYLRYEYQPKVAQQFLKTLCDSFPNNYYAKAKYLESIASPEDFKKVNLNEIQKMINHESPYYQLAGHVFYGYYLEVIQNAKEEAKESYEKGIKIGETIPNNGEYYKSLGYLGLGRISFIQGNRKEAESQFKWSLHYAETQQIKEESKSYLDKL